MLTDNTLLLQSAHSVCCIVALVNLLQLSIIAIAHLSLYVRTSLQLTYLLK